MTHAPESKGWLATAPRPLLPALAVLGLAFCVFLGWRAQRSELEVARLRVERAAAGHLGLIRDHLTARETLARAVGATFNAPERIAAGGLASLDPRFLSLVPDITSFVWVPRVEPERAGEVLAALAAAGVERPAILGPARAPAPAPEPGRPLRPVLDIVPPTPTNRLSLGLDLGALPLPRAALAESERRRDAVATAPLELVQLPGEKALVLYVPVNARGEAGGTPLGHLGFAYRFGALLEGARGAIPDGIGIAIADALAPEAGLVFAAGPPRPDGVAPLLREASFGARPWRVEYWPAEDPRAAAWRVGLATGCAAAIALLASLLVAARLSAAGRRLGRALGERERAEARLRTVIGELNHRTTNILAVAQGIVSQTLREGGGATPEELAEHASERLRAMGRATALLRDAEWQGVRLGRILDGSGLPFADRVSRAGPDVALAAGPAQSIVLLVHELWTNAAKHGALSVPGGRVRLAVAVEGGQFRLDWIEEGGPPAELGERRGFGRVLIEELVPRQLGGEARLAGEPHGLRYALDAPAAEVLAEQA